MHLFLLYLIFPSTWLQDICLGRTLPLDASTVSEYSLFPGQIVAAKVTNPNGSRIVASKIW
jgi:hypothetical protein